MTRELAIEWLDKQVDAINVLNTPTDFGVEVCCKIDSVCIFSGFFVLANAIGAIVKRERFDAGTYNVKVSFEYRGITFSSLYRAEIPEYDINSLELKPKEGEELFDEPVGVFKEMDKIIEDFNDATNYTHKESGVLGEV